MKEYRCLLNCNGELVAIEWHGFPHYLQCKKCSEKYTFEFFAAHTAQKTSEEKE